MKLSASFDLSERAARGAEAGRPTPAAMPFGERLPIYAGYRLGVRCGAVGRSLAG
jgi:hypothetical protein